MNFEETIMWNRLTDQVGNYYTEAVEEDRETFRIWLKGLLHQGKVTLEFIKADGSTRVMNCTLSEDFGATFAQPKQVEQTLVESKPKKVNNDSCAVWDCDSKAWRSFRWDRLKRIDFKI